MAGLESPHPFLFMSNQTDTFSFFLPASVIKAEKDKDGKRWIQGIASTDHLDLQGETVAQKGIDYTYFLSDGYINDDHKDGPEHKVGEPTEAKVTKDGFWIKGFLYKGKERSDYWWEHLNALERSDSNRKVGFSIQGKVTRRAGKKIVKCWLQDVAITASPVNTKTWAEIVKSLNAEKWEENFENLDKEEKALSAGGDGGALIPESLEGGVKVTTYKSISDIPPTENLSHDEWIRVVQLDKGWSRATAKAVVDAIFIKKGLR